jgi:hypothetical protein
MTKNETKKDVAVSMDDQKMEKSEQGRMLTPFDELERELERE